MAKQEPKNTPGPSDTHHPAEERLKMLEAIADGADDLREREGEFELDQPDSPPGENKQAEAKPVEDQQEMVKESPETEPEKAPEPKRFKLKVGGTEREMTEEELVATAQKVAQADEYLRIASETVKKAIEPVPPVLTDEPDKVQEEDFALARALQMGSEEDAARAIHNLRNSRPSVTPDDVRQIARATLSLESVLAAAEGKHQDLLSDPLLGKLFRLRLQEMKSEAPDTQIPDAYDQIGDELRKRFPTQAEASNTQAKLKRKASVAPVPTAAARQATATEEEGEENVADVIAAMAKARKQERPFH